MIGNFRIVSGSTAPWLEALITKDGLVPLYTQAASYNCEDQQTDPNMLDLTTCTLVQFQMFKCGRTPVEVALQGVAEKVQSTVTEGAGSDTEVTKITDLAKVRYKWHPDDTSEPDLYYGRFVLTFEDGSILKWPYQLESLAIDVVP
jgi:hypothetical protein